MNRTQVYEYLHTPYKTMERLEFDMINDAMNAISISEAEMFIKNYTGESFMLCNNPLIYTITKNMKYDGHSGSSFGMTMQMCRHYLKNPEEWSKKKGEFS